LQDRAARSNVHDASNSSAVFHHVEGQRSAGTDLARHAGSTTCINHYALLLGPTSHAVQDILHPLCCFFI
jgi:hypothetical protein